VDRFTVKTGFKVDRFTVISTRNGGQVDKMSRFY